jgi:hypothetical protein
MRKRRMRRVVASAPASTALATAALASPLVGNPASLTQCSPCLMSTAKRARPAVAPAATEPRAAMTSLASISLGYPVRQDGWMGSNEVRALSRHAALPTEEVGFERADGVGYLDRPDATLEER